MVLSLTHWLAKSAMFAGESIMIAWAAMMVLLLLVVAVQLVQFRRGRTEREKRLKPRGWFCNYCGHWTAPGNVRCCSCGERV